MYHLTSLVCSCIKDIDLAFMDDINEKLDVTNNVDLDVDVLENCFKDMQDIWMH